MTFVTLNLILLCFVLNFILSAPPTPPPIHNLFIFVFKYFLYKLTKLITFNYLFAVHIIFRFINAIVFFCY